MSPGVPSQPAAQQADVADEALAAFAGKLLRSRPLFGSSSSEKRCP